MYSTQTLCPCLLMWNVDHCFLFQQERRSCFKQYFPRMAWKRRIGRIVPSFETFFWHTTRTLGWIKRASLLYLVNSFTPWWIKLSRISNRTFLYFQYLKHVFRKPLPKCSRPENLYPGSTSEKLVCITVSIWRRNIVSLSRALHRRRSKCPQLPLNCFVLHSLRHVVSCYVVFGIQTTKPFWF